MKKEIKLKQKKIFLKGEGDNWYLRNKKFSNKERFKTKYLYSKINQIIKKINNKLNFLEIGSSNGLFLLLLKNKIKDCNLIGVDPSKKAITPSHEELKKNPPSRSAKLRFLIKKENVYEIETDVLQKFKHLFEIEKLGLKL